MENLTQALIAAQQEFAPLKKSATNPHFKNKFVPLSEVLTNVLPILNKNGLAVSQFPSTTSDNEPALTTLLMHASGEVLKYTMPLLAAKNDPQGQGSAITYARRYALMSVLGVVGDEDDDGNAAQPKRPSRAAQPVAADPLAVAKDELRQAISNAKLSKEEAADFAWVKTATEGDIDRIKGAAAALNLGVSSST